MSFDVNEEFFKTQKKYDECIQKLLKLSAKARKLDKRRKYLCRKMESDSKPVIKLSELADTEIGKANARSWEKTIKRRNKHFGKSK